MKFFEVLLKITAGLILLFTFVYLAVPSPRFPKQLPDSVQSLEEADLETPLRRTYFSNMSRSDILKYYQKQLAASLLIPVPAYIVYYPPEDSQILIRDQTRTVHLPEIIHPFRESLFVNFFEAKSAKDEIWYKGVHYQERITLRYVPSSPVVRIVIIFVSVVVLLFLFKEVVLTVVSIFRKTLSR